MEAATVVEEADVTFDGESEASRSAGELFEWSGYVHVGRGALDCEHRLDGACKDPEHFHAWLCLPNQYQIRDVVDKARAAKARKLRALRDPESDSHVTLEVDLDELRHGEMYEQLTQAIARRNVEKRLAQLIDDVRDSDRFEHHDQDAEEFRRLQALPEDERDAEEFARLEADMVSYAEELQRLIDQEHEAEVASLKRRSVDDVIDMERQARIEELAWESYNHVFYTWTIYVGARQPTTEGFPSVRKFKTPDQQRDAPPEVLTALRNKIRELEARTVKRSDAAGNS